MKVVKLDILAVLSVIVLLGVIVTTAVGDDNYGEAYQRECVKVGTCMGAIELTR